MKILKFLIHPVNTGISTCFFQKVKMNLKYNQSLYFILILWLMTIIYPDCSGNGSKKLLGKWKVAEVGIKGMEITYEFTESKIIIESIVNKNIADSTVEDAYTKIEENYSIERNSYPILLLKAENVITGDTGNYTITIDNDKMILIDHNNEKTILNRMKIVTNNPE